MTTNNLPLLILILPTQNCASWEIYLHPTTTTATNLGLLGLHLSNTKVSHGTVVASYALEFSSCACFLFLILALQRSQDGFSKAFSTVWTYIESDLKKKFDSLFDWSAVLNSHINCFVKHKCKGRYLLKNSIFSSEL